MIPNDKKIGPWTYIWAFIRFATAGITLVLADHI